MGNEVLSMSLTRDDSWLLELANIPKELREEEAALMQSRWFDQRDLLPAQATYYFTNRYDVIYREHFAMMRDRDGAKEAMTRVVDDVFKGSDLIPMWKARQEADRIGCRYDFYLYFVFRRIWDRGHRMLPRPNQLYGDELILDIKDAWEAVKQVSLQLASSPRFKPDAFIGHPDQVAYHSYLVEQIKQREQQAKLIARLVFREGILPIEIASEHFDSETLRRAKFFI